MIGEGVIDADNTCPERAANDCEQVYLSLRQFQYAQHGVARHQRYQAQGLNLIAPGVEQHAFMGANARPVRGLIGSISTSLKTRSVRVPGFIDFALFVSGMLFIKIVSGVDVELRLYSSCVRRC